MVGGEVFFLPYIPLFFPGRFEIFGLEHSAALVVFSIVLSSISFHG